METSCHHCGSSLERGKTVPLRNNYTGGQWYSFCSDLCRELWVAEWQVIFKRRARQEAELKQRLLEFESSHREQPVAQGKPYPEVILHGGKLAIIPASSITMQEAPGSPSPACKESAVEGATAPRSPLHSENTNRQPSGCRRFCHEN